MKRFFGNHAYEILISTGFICLILVSWAYSNLQVTGESAFWESVYSGAFVDIISLVISTILITALINRKRTYETKKELYTIIKYAHNNLFANLYVKYLYAITVREGEIHGKVYDKEEIKDYKNIETYLRKHVSSEYNFEKVIIVKNIKEKYQGGVTDKVIKEQVARSYLFEEYVDFVNIEIERYLKEYHFLLNSEYISILIEVKEYLKYNPFLLFKFDEDDDCGVPTYITDIDLYITHNQNYVNQIFKLYDYFKEVE